MIHLKELSKRQRFIIEVVSRLGTIQTGALLEEVNLHFEPTSRITVIRDLHALVSKKLLKKMGAGRSIFYTSSFPPLLRPFDVETYFRKEPDKRLLPFERFSFQKDSSWDVLLSAEELKHIHRLTENFQNRMKRYDKQMLQKELERVTIEFSWKSSLMEGDTYTLLDTERLIREHKEATGKKHEEAVIILNHKEALEYAWKHAKSFRKLSKRGIEEFHDLIIQNLNVQRGLRKHPVGIIGTAYKPHDNQYQILEAMEGLCAAVNSIQEPFLKALVATLSIAYIQPFEDGNKRTSRLTGNALLLAHGYCPLSYRSIDEIEYKKALILFYEQHTLFLFKKLFLEQYEFAVKNYFL